MQFYRPEALNLIWIAIPLLIGLFLWSGRRKKSALRAFGEELTVTKLIQGYSSGREKLKICLFVLAMILLILALAQPQWGEEKKQIKRKGIDLVFMVDTSLSMLAQDVKPSRIEKSKFLMKSFLKHLKGDRIGIVTFAGSGFLQSPLTLDYSAFALFADSIQVGYIPDPGSNLSEGIEQAIKSFATDKHKYRALIILTDGEATDGNVKDAIEIAKKEGVRIYTIGIGTLDGEPIPLKSEDGKISGYKKDAQGQIVITKLNEEVLKDIAKETGGLYFKASPSETETDLIYQHLQSLGKKELKERLVVEREDRFQSFILIGLILILIESLLSDRVIKR